MEVKMRCNTGSFDEEGNPIVSTVSWKYFTAQCTNIQQGLGICNGTSGAYVPAITVCIQRLF